MTLTSNSAWCHMMRTLRASLCISLCLFSTAAPTIRAARLKYNWSARVDTLPNVIRRGLKFFHVSFSVRALWPGISHRWASRSSGWASCRVVGLSSNTTTGLYKGYIVAVWFIILVVVNGVEKEMCDPSMSISKNYVYFKLVRSN